MLLKRIYDKTASARTESIRARRNAAYDQIDYLRKHLKMGGLNPHQQAEVQERINQAMSQLAVLELEAAELPVTHVEAVVLPDQQKFGKKTVERAMKQGWIRKERDKLVVVTDKGEVRYRVRREPGWYCCHDGRKFPDAASARAYTLATYAGKPSPDKNNPAGFEQLHSYDCVKEG